MKRRLRFWLTTLLGGYIALGLFIALIEPKLVFHPSKTPLSSCALPNGVHHIDFAGQRGLFTEGGGEKLLVFYHGNAESACNWRFLGVNHASQFGFDTLVMEYPGYSADPQGGAPSAARITDMVAATHAWAQARYAHVATMGFSLGTGAASTHAALGGVAQVALFAPYQSLFELAQSKGYPFPKLWFRNDLDSVTALIDAETPVHIVYGENDVVVPPSRSKALIDRLQRAGVPVTQRPVSGAGHGGLFGPATLDEALRRLSGG